MKTINFNLEELNEKELEETNGGFLGVLIPVILASATVTAIATAFYAAATKGYDDGKKS
jgi:lactobin A/cerein 7B family class IIb bacteriocin